MKALVLKEYNRLVFEDAELPDLGNNDVLVRVKACSICGSDVHGMDGSTGRRIPPIIMGHEASGIIERTSAGVKTFRQGDRVTFDSTVYCGECYYCRRGKVNLCNNRRVLGVSCGDYRMHGAFAEYVAIPHHILYSLPDNVSFEQAAMVEPLSVAMHAVGQVPALLNKTAVVIGSGTIGLLIVQLLGRAGCKKVIAVDLSSKKLETACRFGADAAVRPDTEDLRTVVLGHTEGRGADMAFDAAGAAATIEAAINSVAKGGHVVLVGNLEQSVNFPLQSVVTRQISLYGSCASSGEYPDCLDMIAAGKVDVSFLISAVAPLSEGAMWFERLRSGEDELMKVILRP